MATCTVEGLDPIRMCRMLMDKMADARQLQSEADPGVLVLFQDWLEKLEEEACEVVKRTGSIRVQSVLLMNWGCPNSEAYSL